MEEILVKKAIEMLMNGQIENRNQIYFKVDGCYFYVDEMYLFENGVEFRNNNYNEAQSYSFDAYIYIEEK